MLEKTFSGFDIDLRDDGVCIIQFNRPEKLNGFNWAVKRDLTEALLQLSYDDRSRVIILTGGENFCAGDEVADPNEKIWRGAISQPIKRERHDSLSTYSSLRAISQGLVRTLRGLDKLTIAAIDGYAIQSGLSMALACDFRIATTRAKLGSATLRMGYMPDEGGHYLLVEYLGVPQTKDFIFNNRFFDGQTALEKGLVNKVVAPQDLMASTLEYATELARGPQVAMRLLKHSIENASRMTFEQAAMDIAVRTAISDHHPDAQEGAAAFRSKPRRKPNFK